MRSERLRELERLGLNVPIYIVVDNKSFERATIFRKKCAVRFDEVSPPIDIDMLRKIVEVEDAIFESSWPPFIPHMSPCMAFTMFKRLSENRYQFKAHVTDVTVKDSVGAGMTLNIDGKIIVEAVKRGTVREISRRGKIDIRAFSSCNQLILEGEVDDLLSYCIFTSVKLMRRFPDSLLEWSCHKGRGGVKGDHLIAWELYKVKNRSF